MKKAIGWKSKKPKKDEEKEKSPGERQPLREEAIRQILEEFLA